MPLTLRRSKLWLLALAGLAALLAAAALSLAPANADGHDSPELVLSLVDDSDNIVAVGSTLTVRAQLRFSGDDAPGGWMNILANSNLRLSGSLDWDDTSVPGSRLPITAAQIAGLPSTEIIPMDGASAFNNEAGTGGAGAWPVAYDNRTLVGYIGNTNGSLLVFDLSGTTPSQVLKLDGAAGEDLGRHPTDDAIRGKARPVAVWDQNATTAWLFAGAPGSGTNVGKLYIWKITYAADGTAAATQITTPLEPPATEYNNRELAADVPLYGHAVSISPDGQTLAVGAPNMNSVGAVYVYTMPSGAGEDWNDLEYADGVKVTPVQIPAWGATANRPFDSSSTMRTGANTHCDAYCSAVTASKDSSFGEYVELAGDGTLAVSATGKAYPSDTAGGSFSGNPANAGAVWVFNAPDGGWSAPPDVNAGKTAFGATLVTTNASTWDPTSHFAPGPAKRVEAAAAELIPAAFGDASRPAWSIFGNQANLSADGSTVLSVAVGDSGAAYIFEEPDGGWASTSTPTAKLDITPGTTGSDEGNRGMDLNYDGSRALIEKHDNAALTNPVVPSVAGVVYVFEPVSGGWAAKDSTPATEEADGLYLVADAQVVTAPTPTGNGRFSAPLYNNDGTLIAWADTDYFGVANVEPKLYLSANPCSDRTLDGETTTTCTLDLGDTTVTVPAGTPEGKFTISGRVNLEFSDGTQPTNGASGSVEVTIGKVQEVASATLGLATDIGDPTQSGDEKPYPALLRSSGDNTRLLLRILNENGLASHGGSVAAVLVTSTAGRLSVLNPDLAGDDCANISCQLDNTEINASNADRLIIVLTHAGKAATASVRATVFSTAGDSFETEPVSIALAGPADSITVASSASGVLNVQAAGTDADGSTTTDAADLLDARDHLLLAVTATDAAGNSVALPSGARRGQVLDPDGKRVASGIRVIFPHRGDPNANVGTDNPAITNAAGAQQVRIDVDRAPTNPLASGEYTLELWAGQKKTTRTFIVSGGPVSDGISLSDPGAVAVGESFTVTATFNDASGAAVPNGTEVDWPEIVTASGAGQQVVLTGKDTRTTDGRASATWLAVNSGSVVVTAGYECAESVTSTGDTAVGDCAVSGVRLVRITGTEQAAAASNPADDLTSRNPASFSTWLGEGRTNAQELLTRLPGAGSLLIWLNGQWVRYGVAEGREIPGSTNFQVQTGAILWIGR